MHNVDFLPLRGERVLDGSDSPAIFQFDSRVDKICLNSSLPWVSGIFPGDREICLVFYINNVLEVE